MLLSMTGYGDARGQNESLSVSVETRSINNRYLKLNTRCPDGLAPREGDIEKTIRSKVRRGTINVSIRVEFPAGQTPCRVDEVVLGEYARELQQVGSSLGLGGPKTLSDLLELPGVLREDDSHLETLETAWDLVKDTLLQALDRMVEFRATEGRSMRTDLEDQIGIIRSQLATVKEHAPEVVREFRNRTLERVRDLLADSDVKMDASDLIREVSIFADRCDINEEITRLTSHLKQFDDFLDHKESQGRKLEFLVQEMFREVNTIGSKANNVKIAHSVVEMKAAIEKMREILQNAE